VTDERLTLRQAAARLGVSESAIRKRVERRTLRSDKGSDGRRYVYLDTGADDMADKGADASATGERTALISEMVEEMRTEVHYLRGQLHQELERRSAEAERYQQIVAALTAANASLSERLRELEPAQGTPTEPQEAAETVEEAPEGAGPRSAAEEAREELGAERARRETAESTLHEGMAEERRRREAAERERDDLRREQHARGRQHEAPEAAGGQQGGGQHHSSTGGAQEEGVRRPWWRRMLRS
jgi:hypothetical protein